MTRPKINIYFITHDLANKLRNQKKKKSHCFLSYFVSSNVNKGYFYKVTHVYFQIKTKVITRSLLWSRDSINRVKKMNSGDKTL